MFDGCGLCGGPGQAAVGGRASQVIVSIASGGGGEEGLVPYQGRRWG